MNGFECMLIKYPSTYSRARNCENITAKSMVEQSGLRFEIASTKHFHII